MAAAGHAKLRRELIGMLLADRKSAIQQRNASAAITASTRIADLLLRQAEEEAAKAQPVTKLVHVIMHQRICPVCKERGTISDTPPPPPEPEAAKPRRASGWDEPDTQPASDPTPLAPVRQPEVVLKIPKTPEQMRRRRRDDPVKRLV